MPVSLVETGSVDCTGKKRQPWKRRRTCFSIIQRSGPQLTWICFAKADGLAQADSFIDAGVMPAMSAAKPTTELVSAWPTLDVRLDLGHGVVLHIGRR